MPSSSTIWMFFLCVWIHLGTTASGIKLIGIRPGRIFTEANRPLKVSCTLNDMADHNLTSEALSFRWKHKEEKFLIPPGYVQRPNITTAVLLLPQVGCERDKSLLSCFAGDNDDSVYVLVGFRPKPSVDLVVTADNWEVITITWTKEKNHRFRTRTKAYWKMELDEPFKLCQNQETTLDKYTCWFEISEDMNLHRSTYFTIKVNSSNSLGSTTTREKIFYLHEINKPAKINNVRLQKVETTWVQLEWESPAHGRSLVYNVTATCLQSTQVFIVAGTKVVDLSLNVTGLMPGTQCELSISARSLHGTKRNDPYTLNISTKDSVPFGLPLTTRGGFDITTSGEHITLYWQPVPVHLRGGQITHYNVIHWEEDGFHNEYEYSAVECQRNIPNKFPKRESKLAVTAKTSVGYNKSIPLQAQVIVLPQTLIERQKPENVTALINSNNVTEVRWSSGSDGQFTGYYCVSNGIGKTCKSIISWIKNVSFPWKVPLPLEMDPRRYRFGISLDLGTASSGISWSDCVSQMQAKSGPPTVENKTTISSIQLKLKHTARCSVDAGFVYAYQITYCRTDGNTCVEPHKLLTVNRTGKLTAVALDGLEENIKYRISVYSITAAGASLNPLTDVITTVAGVKTKIVSRLPIYLVVGIVLAILLLVGIYCVCTKCREKCRKVIEKLHIPIKLPDEDIKKSEVNSDEMTIEYAVPYHNLKNGSASPEGRAQDMIGSYSNVVKPSLPPRMQSLTRSDNDSGVSFTSEVLSHPPPASSPVKKGQLPQNVSIITGGSTEDILNQNQKNIMKDDDYDYNYAPTFSLDETVDGMSKAASLSESTCSSGDESDHYKEAAILLKNVNPLSASNLSKASDEEGTDLSGSSYGYKPVLLHDFGKSSSPLLSRNPLPSQPMASPIGGPWEHVQPTSKITVDEPISVCLDPAIILNMSDGDHIDCYSVEDINLEDNDSDYGYAPTPIPGLVIGTPDNAWYPA